MAVNSASWSGATRSSTKDFTCSTFTHARFANLACSAVVQHGGIPTMLGLPHGTRIEEEARLLREGPNKALGTMISWRVYLSHITRRGPSRPNGNAG
jgi:hypothetical protein